MASTASTTPSFHQTSFGFLSGSVLKLTALVTMTIDHVGAVLFPGVLLLRGIGRIAFPIYCFLLVEGYLHTKDVRRYLARLLIFALLSDVPFDLAFYKTPFTLAHQNVYFTLALGLIAIWVLDKQSNLLIRIAGFLVPFLAATFLHTDYRGGGVVLIVLLYLFRDVWYLKYGLSLLLFYAGYGLLELAGGIAFLFTGLYNGKRGFLRLKYVFYAYYPVHLLVIYLIYRMR